MLLSSSIARMATAPKFSTTSLLATLPPGIRTSSARRAKILPTYMVSDETVSKSCSATGFRFLQLRIVQLLPELLGMFRSVRMLGNVHPGKSLLRLVAQGRADERDEQRMRPRGPALQLRVRLRADDERMNVGGVLDELDEVAVRRRSTEPQPALGDPVAVGIVHLVAVAVTLGNFSGAVCLRNNGIGLQHRRIGTQAHGAAQVGLTG